MAIASRKATTITPTDLLAGLHIMDLREEKK
jgi:hypothetical protein